MRTEWLLTNGIGGYAMGTKQGVNMRRYHGLLVAAATPPVGRVVALHSVIEEVEVHGERPCVLSLSSQHFGDEPVTHPKGANLIEDVTVSLPDELQWRYRLSKNVQLIRTLRLVRGRNRVVLTYQMQGIIQAVLRLRPLVALRDFHSLNRAGDLPIVTSCLSERSVSVARGESAALALELAVSSGTFRAEPDWWRSFAYLYDRERGQDWHEDVFTPGAFEAALSNEQPRVELAAELEMPERIDVPMAKSDRASSHSTSAKSLEDAGAQFVVHRRVGSMESISIIAGYPWFADWGRDTMICVPGLLLSTGRFTDAERCLVTFARHLRGGLIPNRFDDHGGAAHYNTVDASLWFIHAVSELLRVRQDSPMHEELIRACRAIIEAYRTGTDFNIRMDERDGLIAAGDPTTQLTWMDAQRDGVTFTPRHGKAVEIAALWHHGLHAMATLTDQADEAAELRSLADRVADSIQKHFWCGRTGCCYDVLTPDGNDWVGDEAIRPNQIFAVSLDPSPLSLDAQRSIVGVVTERLLTPFGLRTLDPAHRQYRSRFEGDLFHRDAAYHQGTVWPWLMGAYCEALLRANGFGAQSRQRVAQLIHPLLDELGADGPGQCAGQLAEVYDGDLPHRPGGCPAQAWSVAELMRVRSLLSAAEGS